MLNPHTAVSVTAAGTNPASCVTAGRACRQGWVFRMDAWMGVAVCSMIAADVQTANSVAVQA